MRAPKKALSIIGLILLACCGAVQASPISNSGFETSSDWALNINNLNNEFSVFYSTDWKSEGLQNLTFRRGTGNVNAGTYGMISQSVDLTGVTGFLFDCQDSGVDGIIVPLNFLVDGSSIGTWNNNGWPGGPGGINAGWGHTTATYDIYIPLSTSYTGLHNFSIQAYNTVTHSPADPKIYRIDNLRVTQSISLVPEPSTLLLLGFGLLGFAGLKKK
jgi:hypothetical protein